MHLKLLKKKKIGFMNSVRPAPPFVNFIHKIPFFLIDGFPKSLFWAKYVQVAGAGCKMVIWSRCAGGLSNDHQPPCHRAEVPILVQVCTSSRSRV